MRKELTCLKFAVQGRGKCCKLDTSQNCMIFLRVAHNISYNKCKKYVTPRACRTGKMSISILSYDDCQNRIHKLSRFSIVTVNQNDSKF